MIPFSYEEAITHILIKVKISVWFSPLPPWPLSFPCCMLSNSAFLVPAGTLWKESWPQLVGFFPPGFAPAAVWMHTFLSIAVRCLLSLCRIFLKLSGISGLKMQSVKFPSTISEYIKAKILRDLNNPYLQYQDYYPWIFFFPFFFFWRTSMNDAMSGRTLAS